MNKKDKKEIESVEKAIDLLCGDRDVTRFILDIGYADGGSFSLQIHEPTKLEVE